MFRTAIPSCNEQAAGGTASCQRPPIEMKVKDFEIGKKQVVAPLGWWILGTRVRKRKGASWQGTIVGYYETDLNPRGYAVESEREPGSVQIYPEVALEQI